MVLVQCYVTTDANHSMIPILLQNSLNRTETNHNTDVLISSSNAAELTMESNMLHVQHLH